MPPYQQSGSAGSKVQNAARDSFPADLPIGAKQQDMGNCSENPPTTTLSSTQTDTTEVEREENATAIVKKQDIGHCPDSLPTMTLLSTQTETTEVERKENATAILLNPQKNRENIVAERSSSDTETNAPSSPQRAQKGAVDQIVSGTEETNAEQRNGKQNKETHTCPHIHHEGSSDENTESMILERLAGSEGHNFEAVHRQMSETVDGSVKPASSKQIEPNASRRFPGRFDTKGSSVSSSSQARNSSSCSNTNFRRSRRSRHLHRNSFVLTKVNRKIQKDGVPNRSERPSRQRGKNVHEQAGENRASFTKPSRVPVSDVNDSPKEKLVRRKDTLKRMTSLLRGTKSFKVNNLNKSSRATNVPSSAERNTTNAVVSSPPNSLDSTHGENFFRTLKHSPSVHQLKLPYSHEVLMCARIAALAESYRTVDQSFDFAILKRMSRVALEGFNYGSPAPPTLSQINGDCDGPVGKLAPTHRPIVCALLACANDIILRDFFRFRARDEKEQMEVAVFSSWRKRQLVVCYRGTTRQQIKPFSKKKKKNGETAFLHPDHPYPVNVTIKAAYFAQGKEDRIFASLNKLICEYQFSDLTVTGHSFGAALATLGAVRYASLFPRIRVSGIVFGSPRIGGAGLRDFTNSLPNLRMTRIEQRGDPWVSMPVECKWAHVGHSIVISSNSTTAKFSASSEQGNPTTCVSAAIEETDTMALGFCFDKRHLGFVRRNANVFGVKHRGKSISKGVDISSYVHTIEGYTHLGKPWINACIGGDPRAEFCDDGKRYIV